MRYQFFAKGLLISLIVGVFPVQAQLITTDSVFTDVDANTTYNQAIKYLKDNKIVQGYSDGSFAPQKTINRAEFTKILVSSINPAPTGNNCFSDVSDQWFAPYICQAKQSKFVSGYADGTFKPDQEINFSEAAKIIANTYNLSLGSADPDVWFKQYVEALQKEQAIPLSIEFFDGNITRQDMSEIIYRIKAKVTDKSTRTFQEISGEGLVKPVSCADLEERYLQNHPPDRGPVNYDYMMKEAVPLDSNMKMAEPVSAPSSSATGGSSGASAPSYSTTNIQEAGVDEADVIKNDGKYIYLIKGNSIRIVEAYPASNLKELINFQLGSKDEDFYPTEMYVDGNQLTVIGTSSSYQALPVTSLTAKMMPIRQYTSRTKVYLVDITDRSKPKVTRTVDFDGSYSTSRITNGTLYLVMNQYPYYPTPYYYNSAVTDSSTSSTQPFSDYLPQMRDSRDNQDVLIAPCTDIRIMPKPRSFNFLITAAVPLNSLITPVARTVMVGSGDNVYASTQNLYVAETEWSGGYYSSGNTHTKLYRFALTPSNISFESEGSVPGTILNQFSMDERYNQFRLATTQDNSDTTGKTSNNLFVLDQSMKIVGQINGLAEGEKLYSARFMGDRAYLVTFKSVDPLFVIDLKDGTNPKVLGQLKIPGYSDYLHPYDATHIIGFGKDVDPSEVDKDQNFVYYTAVKGFKMGMFDVTDPANPKEMYHEVIGDQGTYSELLNNHKALLFDKDKNLLAFPITVTEMPKQEAVCSNFIYSTCPSSCQKVCQSTCTYENGITICKPGCDGLNSCQDSSYVYPKNVFVGAYVYSVDLQNGFKLKAKLTHLDQQGITDLLTNGYADYEKTIERILYIGDSLYTVSQGAVKANSLSSNLIEQGIVQLAGDLYNLSYGSTITPSMP